MYALRAAGNTAHERYKVMEKNRFYWWVTENNHIKVHALEGSKQQKVLSKVTASCEKIGKDTFFIDTSVADIFYPRGFFAKLNRAFARHGIDPKEHFRERLNVPRSFEELKSISITNLECVHEFKPPRNKKNSAANSAPNLLKKIGIESVFDAIFYLPRKYIDQTNPIESFAGLFPGENVVVVGEVESAYTSNGRIPRTVVNVKVSDSTTVEVVFFRQPWIARITKKGTSVVVNGKYGEYRGKPQVSGVSIERNSADTKPVVPVYKQSPQNGMTTKFLSKVVAESLDLAGNIKTPDYLDDVLNRNIVNVLRKVHEPETIQEQEEAREDMALYEMVLLQSLIQYNNSISPTASTVVSAENHKDPIVKELIAKHLPFVLTSDQHTAVERLCDELASGSAENILLSADVGAGKTIIAQLGALRAVEAGSQAVLAAPTEVLARQLYEKTVDLVSYRDDIKVAYLTGKTKAKERKELEKCISSGEVDIVVGTHVTLSNPHMYNSLGFVCIDEQHKFGAAQRSAISEAISSKTNSDKNKTPVVMQQTATPIPRSMAQGLFGSMSILRLSQKPNGRKPILTKWVRRSPSFMSHKKDDAVWKSLDKEIDKGNQAFVIAPFVTDSAFIEDVSSVEALYESLSTKVFPHRRIAVIHGKMKSQDVEETMKKVRNKEYDIVIASTVVEVGVDIPDATFIAIMSADRLGIASLHQLRGRVGRNDKQSYCVLVSNSESENSVSRMQALESSNDGFELAEMDLKNRGAGKLLGSEQSGESEIRFSNDIMYPELLQLSYDKAREMIVSSRSDIALKDAESYFGKDIVSSDFNSILI